LLYATLFRLSLAAWPTRSWRTYPPPEAQDRLLDNITALSADGSRLATETVPDMLSCRCRNDTKLGNGSFETPSQR
jgi:hypothetical protein